MKMNGQMSSRVCQFFILTPIKIFFLTCYVADPAKRKQFKQFVNTSERRPQTEIIEERGQQRPVNWPRTSAPLKLTVDQLKTPKNQWTWVTVAKKDDIILSENGTTNFAVKYGDTQLAVFHVPKRGFYATQQM